MFEVVVWTLFHDPPLDRVLNDSVTPCSGFACPTKPPGFSPSLRSFGFRTPRFQARADTKKGAITDLVGLVGWIVNHVIPPPPSSPTATALYLSIVSQGESHKKPTAEGEIKVPIKGHVRQGCPAASCCFSGLWLWLQLQIKAVFPQSWSLRPRGLSGRGSETGLPDKEPRGQGPKRCLS